MTKGNEPPRDPGTPSDGAGSRPDDHVYPEELERDIVDAMLYLVSEQASFVTGETLRVSGGFALGL